MHDGDSSELIQTYLERREALIRYFVLRTRSEALGEDLVQDIYLKISAMAPDAVAEVRNPAAFLYRLGSNLMLDRIKAERRSRAREDAWRETETVSSGGEDISDEPAADDALAARQRLEQVIAALNDLAPQTRRAFRLHKLEGKTHAETAAEMGVSKSAIEKHISAALKHLLKKLE